MIDGSYVEESREETMRREVAQGSALGALMILILLVGLAVTTSWVLLWLDYRSSGPRVGERLLAHTKLLLGYWQETIPWVPSPTDWNIPTLYGRA